MLSLGGCINNIALLLFFFLQETYSSKECENAWQAEWGGKVFFNHGTKHSKGTMILFHSKLHFKIENQIVE